MNLLPELEIRFLPYLEEDCEIREKMV